MDSNGNSSAQTEAVKAAQEGLARAYRAALAEAQDEQALRIVDDALWRYLDQPIDLTRAYLAALADCFRMSLRVTFEFQDNSLRTWQTLFDAALSVSLAYLDRAAGPAQTGRDVVASG